MLGIKVRKISIGFPSIMLRDLFGHKNKILANYDHLKAAVDWIKLAQDTTKDGGVSAGYFYGLGWKPSYPEITGYIIPTMFSFYHFAHDDECRQRAIVMSDFLVSIQLINGAFQAGLVGTNVIPEVFDTGQCMEGLMRCYEETRIEKYLASAIRAGDWLVSMQDEDGSWKRHSLNGVPHTYYARVAWPLLELYGITKETKYMEAAKKNIEWASTNCTKNGWYHNCGFGESTYGSSMLNPLTHTIAYTAEGILECGIRLDDSNFIQTASLTMKNLLKVFQAKGHLNGTYNENWESNDDFSCLTGDAQIALIWLRLFKLTGDSEYKDAAVKLNNFLKTTQTVRKSSNVLSGGIKGSQPIYGKYEWLGYPSWASKFFIDSLLLEENIRSDVS